MSTDNGAIAALDLAREKMVNLTQDYHQEFLKLTAKVAELAKALDEAENTSVDWALVGANTKLRDNITALEAKLSEAQYKLWAAKAGSDMGYWIDLANTRWAKILELKDQVAALRESNTRLEAQIKKAKEAETTALKQAAEQSARWWDLLVKHGFERRS